MPLCKRHRIGILMLMLTTVAVYLASVWSARNPVIETSLPWGNQESGMLAVEIAGDKKRDGVYFLQKANQDRDIKILTNGEGDAVAKETGQGGHVLGSAVTIKIDGGVVKYTDMPAAKRLALGLPIDPNLASVDELALIPGIGSKTAENIVLYRDNNKEFMVLEDLMGVPGIGAKKFNDMKKYLALEKKQQLE